MSTDILTRKLDKSFSRLDTDGNDVIDRADLLALGAEVAKDFGFEPESPRAAAIAENLTRLWKALAEQVDLDGDGRITRDEFQQGMRLAFSSQATYHAFFRPAVDAVLSLFDADADGLISQDEWRRVQAGYGTTPEQADEAFGLLDSNGNGYLTRAEISIATHEFYISEDAEAQGNRLFGTLD